jgi:HD-GYP domain-containing protein (c-di-GMP phosphodiesterase class II)
MMSQQEKIQALGRLGVDLNQVQDLDVLMEAILTQARRFVNADAGSIYIRQDNMLRFTYTQNDTLQKRLGPSEKLIYSTFSLPVDTKSLAGFVAVTGKPLAIEDAHAIPPEAPYGFDKSFDSKAGYRTGSMLTLPLKNSRGNLLGVLQIINSQDASGKVCPFGQEDQQVMSHFGGIAAVALERAQMTRALLLRMISMAEMRDPKETGAHVNRVGAYSLELYERWAAKRGENPDAFARARDSIRMAAMLHDVGKVAISDLILKKPGRFEKDEFEIMKQHTVLGARLFLDPQSDFDEAASLVALNHHERWDGNGYPGHVAVDTGLPLAGHILPDGRPVGKKGEEIPLLGRIVSLCDVYDALSSKRVYKEAWTEKQTLDAIEQGSGTQFDPELVELFFGSLDVLRSIQQRYKDKEENQ